MVGLGSEGGAMIDFEAARATMVESQLRTDRVTDRRILAAFAALPRERFVPAAKRDLAYSDAALEVWPVARRRSGALSPSARRARAA